MRKNIKKLKLKPLGSLKPGDYFHYIDTGFPGYFRVYYGVVDKRRKPKPIECWKGAIGTPIRLYGLTQEHTNSFRSRNATHTHFDARVMVNKVKATNWKPVSIFPEIGRLPVALYKPIFPSYPVDERKRKRHL